MRFTRLLILFLVFICISCLSFAQEESEEDETSLDGRGYGLYVPSTYSEDGTESLPLVIALHGAGGTWQNFYPITGLINRAEQDNFIVAFPQGYLYQWNDGSVGDHYEDDVQILLDLIDRIDRDYRLDRKRVYLVGFSNGGTMVFRAACEQPGVFAGIASIAGTMRQEQAENCSTDAALPVLIVHGTADSVVPFGGSAGRYPAPLGVAWWVENNACNIEGVPFYDEALFQNGFATYFFEDCPDGNLVLFYALEDVPHIWPGADAYINERTPEPIYDTARLIWGFFDITYQAQQDAGSQVEVTPEVTEAVGE